MFVSDRNPFCLIRSDPCNILECKFYSMCVLVSTNAAACRCDVPSPSLPRQQVCGSDGQLYKNREEMQYESCRLQKKIVAQEYKNCGI